MLETLFNKMTNCMMWCLVVSTTVLIISLAGLVFCYSVVVWNSKEISYEGTIGKITVHAGNIENQLQEARNINNNMVQTIAHLKLSLHDLEQGCVQISATPSDLSNEKRDIVNKFVDMKNELSVQSNLLQDQKIQLDSVDQNLKQFKNVIKPYADKYLKTK